MIVYRLHRGSIEMSMAEAKEFDTVDIDRFTTTNWNVYIRI